MPFREYYGLCSGAAAIACGENMTFSFQVSAREATRVRLEYELADRSDIAETGSDRQSMCLHRRDIDLIEGVKRINPNTLVSIAGGSAILTDEWEKDVPAIIFSLYSGMEGGNAPADILW